MRCAYIDRASDPDGAPTLLGRRPLLRNCSNHALGGRVPLRVPRRCDGGMDVDLTRSLCRCPGCCWGGAGIGAVPEFAQQFVQAGELPSKLLPLAPQISSLRRSITGEHVH